MLRKSDVKKLRKSIHAMNQRLLQLEKSFGGKNSATYKNAVASFKSADLEKFVSGNDRIVASKVLKAIQEGKSEGEVERILNMTGYRITEKGNLGKTTKGARIPTVTELKRQYEVDYGKPPEGVNIYDEINQIQEVGNDLHELIYEIQDRTGTPGGHEKIEELWPELFGKNERGELTYSQVEKIKREARNILYGMDEKKNRTEASKKIARMGMSNGGLKNE